VFLIWASAPTPGLVLNAIDHTHAFTCGRELTRTLSSIDKIQDEMVYGCFPEFRPLLTADEIGLAVDRLQRMDRALAEGLVQRIPREWQVEDEVRTAWVRLISERAGFVARHLEAWIWPEGGGNAG